MTAAERSEFESLEPDWLAVEEAQERILAAATEPRSEDVPASDAVGRAIAEDVAATATLPFQDNSAMDGFAVRGQDIVDASPEHPVRLRVIGRVAAGDRGVDPIGPGEAVRIMTGGAVPPGADSVVRVEHTDAGREEGFVTILDRRDRGRNVRPAGEDVQVGDVVLSAGDTIHWGTVGVLHALGRPTVRCACPPRVAVVATGNELKTLEAYDEVRRGEGIPEANGPMIAAAVAEAGCTPVYLGIASDDTEGLRRHLEAARAEADALITLGGASMGDADLVKRVLGQMDFRIDFWRARVRPGSPVSFGHLPRDGEAALPVFGLPGNPASSFVTFELFVRPFLRRAAGHRKIHRPVVRCVAGEHLIAPKGLLYAIRVAVDSTTAPPTVRTTGPQGSGLVRSMAAADGLALIPEAADGAEPGQAVDVMLTAAGLTTEGQRPPALPS